MDRDPPNPPTDLPVDSPGDPSVQQGLRISAYSLAWTVVAGSAAIAIGVVGNSLSLAVFGIIGLLDAVGSATLILHFRHALRHEAVSEERERTTLLVVSIGMAVVGLATIADSVVRLHGHTENHPLAAGSVIAAVSIVVLTALAIQKRRIARRIPSDALYADGWLSTMGSLLAGVTLLGTVLDEALGWWWMDPVAAIAVAGGAITLSILLTRGTFALRPQME